MNIYPPTILPETRRIIAIGDIHGDYNLAINLLQRARVIDSQLRWIGMDTIVVQVGDQIDSCRDEVHKDCHIKSLDFDKGEDLMVLNLFRDLHKKATVFGGAVYSLLGNHEIMNIQGYFQYVSYKNMNRREELFRLNGDIAREFAENRPIFLIIGSNLFVHAGIVNAKSREDLIETNKKVHDWLLGMNTSDMKSILDNMNISPLWTRYFGTLDANLSKDNEKCALSNQVLEALNLNSIIIGHTPQNGINSTCQSIFRIDGGYSNAYGETTNENRILQIMYDREFSFI